MLCINLHFPVNSLQSHRSPDQNPECINTGAMKLMSASDHSSSYTGPYYSIDIAFTEIFVTLKEALNIL